MPKKIVKVIASLQVEGLHFWKDCDIEEVRFLKNLHRHIFHITVKKKVSHNDRDIEIIKLQRSIKSFLMDKFVFKDCSHGTCHFGNMSCEDIAEMLVDKFKLDYCKVLEDNENGAEIEIR
tara:strand:+ start:2042 stop:2401 length:360 start_codon:yes stop_codon:yes gene_type:complete